MMQLRRLRIPPNDSMAAEDEPCSPPTRLFIRPEIYSVILCIIGFKHPIDVEAFKQELGETLIKQKRFSSLLKKGKNGLHYWQKTCVDLDDHIVIPTLSDAQVQNDKLIEEYIAGLSMAPPFNPSRPLWELHIINAKCKDAGASCVLRVHHSLGDGTSLMALFFACTRRVEQPELLPSIPSSTVVNIENTRRSLLVTFKTTFMSFLQRIHRSSLATWYTIVGVLNFVLQNSLLDDSKMSIRGPPGVEYTEKCFAIATLNLDDMKIVKKATAGTVNDVLMGVISSGLRCYLLHHSNSNYYGGNFTPEEDSVLENGSNDCTPEKDTLRKLRVTALAMMNIRPSPGLQELANMMKWGTKARWGNHMGYLLIHVPLGECRDPLGYVHRAKAINDKKKLSYEAAFSYKSGALIMNLLGPVAATKLTYRSLIHTTFSISNIVGPKEEVMFAGNPIRHIVPTSHGIPQALTIHMISYMTDVKLGIIVSKNYIPDPEILSRCFVEALRKMKHAAL
eukprot:c28283_g1_i2 orf=60-1580(+)